MELVTTGQAMEIGSAAINILIDTWEGHLTPQEAASLADRASRGRDPNMVRAAAELALSCLPHAQALNPNEIQRALIQCKEQSRSMLERACLAVESAAKGGGVYPEVLFDVAKRWAELYEEAVAGSSQSSAAAASAAAELQQQHDEESNNNSPPAAAPAAVLQLVPSVSLPLAVQPLQYSLPAAGQLPPHHPYIAPYSYVQQVPPNLAHHYSAPPLALHTHSMHPSYMATYPYQQQPPQAPPQQVQQPFPPATLYHANLSALRPTAVPVFAAGRPTLVQNKFGAALVEPVVVTAPMPPVSAAAVTVATVSNEPLPAQNSAAMTSLLAAYRVGMLAMETLARRVHDDRPQTKYARNPPYGEDVKWLHAIAMKLCE